MKVFLIVVAVFSLLGAFATMGASKSAIHEIEAYVMALVGVVSLVGYGVIGRLDTLIAKKSVQ